MAWRRRSPHRWPPCLRGSRNPLGFHFSGMLRCPLGRRAATYQQAGLDVLGHRRLGEVRAGPAALAGRRRRAWRASWSRSPRASATTSPNRCPSAPRMTCSAQPAAIRFAQRRHTQIVVRLMDACASATASLSLPRLTPRPRRRSSRARSWSWSSSTASPGASPSAG